MRLRDCKLPSLSGLSVGHKIKGIKPYCRVTQIGMVLTYTRNLTTALQPSLFNDSPQEPIMAIPLPTFVFSTTAEQAASDLSSRIVGKTVLITGISKGGLGFETARVIGVYKPKLLILAGRNASKNEESKSSIQAEAPDVQIKTLELDLGSFEAVRKSADTLKAWDWEVKGIDILINNAAVMYDAHSGTWNIG